MYFLLYKTSYRIRMFDNEELESDISGADMQFAHTYKPIIEPLNKIVSHHAKKKSGDERDGRVRRDVGEMLEWGEILEWEEMVK